MVFPIVATFYRKNKELSSRRFSRIGTAFPRAVQVLMLDGQPGDVVEFSSREWGFQIGTVKIHAGGRMSITWSIENVQSIH